MKKLLYFLRSYLLITIITSEQSTIGLSVVISQVHMMHRLKYDNLLHSNAFALQLKESRRVS